MDKGLVFSNVPGTLERDDQLTVWSDADWGGDIDGRKSRTGGLVTFNGIPVEWISTQQATVALSSMESEFMASSAVASTTILYRQILEELGLEQSTTVILGDNTSCISLTRNAQTSKRAKHIDLRYYFIRDLVKNQVIVFTWTDTKNELADILTKPLGPTAFHQLMDKILRL